MGLESSTDKRFNEGRVDCKMTKELSVAFITEKLKREFESLKEGKFEDEKLYKFIDRAIDDLKKKSSCGIKIPRKLWPKLYVQMYNITNLWKYGLPNGWRLVYTIETDEIKIVSIILEWFNHKEYEKRIWILIAKFINNK